MNKPIIGITQGDPNGVGLEVIIKTLQHSMIYDYCIPRIFSEAEGYIIYKHDVSNMYMPMARPNFNDYKHKTLELKPWF